MRRLLLSFLMVFGLMNVAFADVDANTADSKQLETIKGIGPKTAQDIIAERTKNGPFKSADDLKKRVKGVGDKKIVEFTKAGLVIGGASSAASSAANPAIKPAETKAAPAKPAEAKKPELKK